MKYQQVTLNEDTLNTLLAAIKVFKLEIDEQDKEGLEQAYQYVQDEKYLEKNSLKTQLTDIPF